MSSSTFPVMSKAAEGNETRTRTRFDAIYTDLQFRIFALRRKSERVGQQLKSDNGLRMSIMWQSPSMNKLESFRNPRAGPREKKTRAAGKTLIRTELQNLLISAYSVGLITATQRAGAAGRFPSTQAPGAGQGGGASPKTLSRKLEKRRDFWAEGAGSRARKGGGRGREERKLGRARIREWGRGAGRGAKEAKSGGVWHIRVKLETRRRRIRGYESEGRSEGKEIGDGKRQNPVRWKGLSRGRRAAGKHSQSLHASMPGEP